MEHTKPLGPGVCHRATQHGEMRCRAGAAVSAAGQPSAVQPSVPRVSPILSVTVLNYNYGRYLPKCIESILGQTFRDFELIVIDDCSTDDSLEVIKPYLTDPRVRVVEHAANVGYAGSLIEGTEIHSTGEFVTVISADDFVWSTEAFERQIAMLGAHPEAAFCFSGYRRFLHETDAVLEEQRSYDGSRIIPGPIFLREFLTRQEIQVLHSGTMLRKSAYDRAGGYRRDLRVTLDLAMWPALALQGDVAYCDGPLYAYRSHGAQMSSSFRKQYANFMEVMKSIEETCATAVRQRVPIGSLRDDAIRYALFAVALDDAFGGRPALALFRSVTAVLFQPRLALTSRGLWITLARLALGGRGYAAAHRLLRKPAAGP
jgi:hypothetical protein